MLISRLLLTAICAACATSAPTLEERAGTDCVNFLTGSQKSFVSGPLPCAQVPNTPSIAGHSIELYHVAGHWNKKHVKLVQNALHKALTFYATYSDPFNVKVVIAPSFLNTATGVEDNLAGDQVDCVILLRDVIPPAPLVDSLTRVRTVAHELYHCVEIRNVPQADTNAQFESSSKWWFEGAAAFFASQQYPEKGHGHFSSYDPKKPLYSQGYAGELFFLSLIVQGWDEAKINGFVKRQLPTDAIAAERSRLAKDPDIPTIFPLFGQAFYDGTISLVSGRQAAADAQFQLQATPVTIHLSQSGPTTESHPYAVNAFTFVVIEIELQGKGTHYDITWAGPGPGTTVWYKPETATDWDDLKQGTLLLAPVGCQAASVKYTFLLTSTDDVAVTAPSVTFTATFAQQDDCCTALASLDARDSPPASCPTKPQPSAPPSAQPCGDIDPCLSGKWKLDVPSTQNLLQKAFPTAMNFKITNSATFEVLGCTSVIQFLDLMLEDDSTSGGADIHQTITTGGMVTSTVVMGTGKEFTWTDVQASGSVVVVDTVISNGMLAGTNTFDISESFGKSEVVSYVCSASSLTLTGTRDQQYDWMWAFQKA